MEETLTGIGEVALNDQALFKVKYFLTMEDNGTFTGTIEILERISGLDTDTLSTMELYHLILKDDEIIEFANMTIGHPETIIYEIQSGE